MKLPVGVLHQSAFSWCLPAPLNLFTCFQLAVGIYSLYCRFQGTPKPVCEADGNRRSQCSGVSRKRLLNTMLSILRKARLKDKEMRILML